MHDPHPGVHAGQAPADMHEAGVVPGAQDLGAGGHDRAHLVRQHRRGGLGVLHREGPPEPAADLGVGEVDEGQALHRPQQPVGAVAHPGHAHGVAGGVVGDRVGEVGAHILQAQDVGQQLGEVIGVGGDLLDPRRQGGVPHMLGHQLLLVAGRPRARARGDDDGVPLPVEHRGEGLDMVAGDAGRMREVAGVGVHLPAADLARWEEDLMAQPLQDGDGGLRRLREHGVRQAGRE
ncbi:hypothetical protein ACSL103130_12805 [Actinomyces slackii]